MENGSISSNESEFSLSNIDQFLIDNGLESINNLSLSQDAIDNSILHHTKTSNEEMKQENSIHSSLDRSMLLHNAIQQDKEHKEGNNSNPSKNSLQSSEEKDEELSIVLGVSNSSEENEDHSIKQALQDAPKDRNQQERSDWDPLNQLLQEHGIAPLHLSSRFNVSISPSPLSVVSLVQDLLYQIDHKNQTIQDLVVSSSQSSKRSDRAENGLSTREKQLSDTQNALKQAQADVELAQEKEKRANISFENEKKEWNKAMQKLNQQLKVSEHRVKAKESLLNRMQEKLQQQVDKDTLKREKDIKMFQKLMNREPRRASSKDTNTLEYLSYYETQIDLMKQEIENLTEQVASLNREIRDHENEKSRHHAFSESGSSYASSKFNNGLVEKLEAARRHQEANIRKLQLREKRMLEKIESIQEECETTQEKLKEVMEINTNLQLDAESRPTIREYRQTQRRVQQLEKQLSEAKLAMDEANDIAELRKYMSTKELMRRDRENSKLQLNRLHALPKETMTEILKHLCRILHLTDVTLLAANVEKLCTVVTAVPRMEHFIRQVCTIVSVLKGKNISDDMIALEDVVPVLEHWNRERKNLVKAQRFQAAIVAELCKRSIEPQMQTTNELATGRKSTLSNPSTLERAVEIVGELIELEKNVLHHKEMYMEAAREVERRPDVLINHIVRHFSHLFQVKKLEGVLPKINELYLTVNEIENFLQVIRGNLQLSKETPIVTCLNTIREQLNKQKDQPDDEIDIENKVNEENYVVEGLTRTDRALSGRKSPQHNVVGIQQVREMSILIANLKRELGAATMKDILPRTKRLMELLTLSIHENHDTDNQPIPTQEEFDDL